MTKTTAYFLTQLRTYLDGQPAAKRRELMQLHERMADGKKLYKANLSRHLHLLGTPVMDTAIVYLRFAQINGIIAAGDVKRGLFLYVSKETAAPARRKIRP